jgi:hypothetical protein
MFGREHARRVHADHIGAAVTVHGDISHALEEQAGRGELGRFWTG